MDQGGAGDITLEGAPCDSGFTGTVAAGAELGACYDRQDVVGSRSPAPGEVQGPGGFVVMINRTVAKAGVALTINRGVLQTSDSFASV